MEETWKWPVTGKPVRKLSSMLRTFESPSTAKVISCLSSGKKTMKEIIKETDMTRQNIYRIIKFLKSVDMIEIGVVDEWKEGTEKQKAAYGKTQIRKYNYTLTSKSITMRFSFDSAAVFFSFSEE